MHREVPGNASPFANIWAALTGETAEAAGFAQLKAVKLPLKTLEAPSQWSAVSAALGLFSTQAHSFAAAHGHPLDSPWRDTPLAKVDPADLSQLLVDLEGLNAVAGELVAIISSHRESGFASEADLRQALAADDALLRVRVRTSQDSTCLFPRKVPPTRVPSPSTANSAGRRASVPSWW